MLRVITLRLYERWLDAPAAPGLLPPDVDLAVWDSPAVAGRAAAPWHPEAHSRLDDGQACAVATHGSSVVAYCWLTRSPARVAEIDRVVVPAPDDVYLYDAFTAPAWRGRGLFRALLLHLVAFASARGRARALIFATSGNRASCRAIERAGFEIVRSVSRVELFGLSILWPPRSRAPASRVTLVEAASARTGSRWRSGARG